MTIFLGNSVEEVLNIVRVKFQVSIISNKGFMRGGGGGVLPPAVERQKSPSLVGLTVPVADFVSSKIKRQK